ncbi:MAG: DUF4440 domain-containing protein [Chloroflexi bacterium]|nr:DUF4440 domain-containing protein [Chloroflexota bacterium]
MTTRQVRTAGAIRALDAEFARYASAGDAAGLVAAFYADESRLLPPNHPAVSGRPAIRDFWQGLLEAGLSDVALETTQVRTSNHLAYGSGRYTLAVRTPSGKSVPDSGKFLVVYRRQEDGSWKAIDHMFSSDQAGP